VLHERVEHFNTKVTVPVPRSKDDWKNFSEKQRKEYYYFAALAFEQLFLK
jgi:hypothetical protein